MANSICCCFIAIISGKSYFEDLEPKINEAGGVALNIKESQGLKKVSYTNGGETVEDIDEGEIQELDLVLVHPGNDEKTDILTQLRQKNKKFLIIMFCGDPCKNNNYYKSKLENIKRVCGDQIKLKDVKNNLKGEEAIFLTKTLLEEKIGDIVSYCCKNKENGLSIDGLYDHLFPVWRIEYFLEIAYQLLSSENLEKAKETLQDFRKEAEAKKECEIVEKLNQVKKMICQLPEKGKDILNEGYKKTYKDIYSTLKELCKEDLERLRR